LFGGKTEHFSRTLHIVVRENETLSSLGFVQEDTVHDAGVRLGIVHNHIVARTKRIDNGNHSLITVIEQIGCLLFLEFGEPLLQFPVKFCLTGHHSGTHRISHSPCCGSFRIRFPYFGMVGESEVII
jgi:hypothetical protein